MGGLCLRISGYRRDERGFTLQELMVTIAIMGILLAIGVIIFLALLERWRVEAATNQLVADLRLAHTSASNQLTDWRVVVLLGQEEEEDGPDYYLIRLTTPYPPAPPVIDTGTPPKPRYFPGNVQVTNVITPAGSLIDSHGAAYWVAPWGTPAPSPIPDTKTQEFNSNGTVSFFASPSGSVCVTVDTNPQNRVISRSSTSRIRIEYDSDCHTS